MTMKHPPRVTGVIEVGPHEDSPYANWGVYEVSPDDFDDASLMNDALLDLDDCLDAVDTDDSPFGPFTEQVRKALQDGRQRLQQGEASPAKKNLVLPYDQDLRERREKDDAAEANPDSAEPRDLDVWIYVHLADDDQ